MTSHLLAAELSNLIQESKRRNNDLRIASENALRDLRALPATSETQLAVDLQRRPHFTNPFLTACKTKNGKLALPAVSCLQRLVIAGGLPNDRLQEVLEAFQDCVNLGLDIQLKILQALPSLLQNYGVYLEGDSQASVLQLCTSLQQVKTVAVASTASATLQQAFSFVFEKVEIDDGRPDEVIKTNQIFVDGKEVAVHAAACDAYRALDDVCLMTDGKPPQYIRKAAISPAFGLELIESVLLNHADVFHVHTEQTYLLLDRVMPLVNRFLAEKAGFAVTVRTVRILCILLREYLDAVESECEAALGLLNYTIDTDSSTPWRRALYLEAFRIIYLNADLVINLYSAFDAREEKKNVVQDNLATFVRLASEKPSLIGLGQQSSVPSIEAVSRAAEQEQAVIEAGNAAGMIGSDFGVSEINVPGISTQWSTMKVSCLDQLDKSDSPQIPETYIYSLVLTCINSLSEVLAKVILPITIQSQQKASRRGKSSARSKVDDSPETPAANATESKTDSALPQRQSSRSLPINPLQMKDHPAKKSIKITATLINDCWPAFLATSSTFLYAALDADFYRGLVRSVQKFTQVAGILRLATPRDAILTALSKAAVPPSLLKIETLATPTSALISPEAKTPKTPVRGLASPSSESFHGHASTESPNRSHRGSVDFAGPSITQRNLMCLRALINLAIALGPILEQGWPIVLESIQKANVLLSMSGISAMARDYNSSSQGPGTDGLSTQTSLGSEITAVESAVARLFHSSSEYPSEAFSGLLKALCALLRPLNSSDASITLRTPKKLQRRVSSMSGISTSSTAQPQYSHFALSKLGEIARINLRRLVYDAQNGGWDLLVSTLTEVSTSTEEDLKARLMAARVLATAAAESIVFVSEDSEKIRCEVQQRSFSVLQNGIEAMQSTNRLNSASTMPADADVQQSLLDSLKSSLERCGDSMVTGWSSVFIIVGSVFVRGDRPVSSQNDSSGNGSPQEDEFCEVISTKLTRIAFSSLQLICSDFLNIVPKSCASALTKLLSQFCSQKNDMNISLTAITLFWNVSDNLQSQIKSFSLPRNVKKSESPTEDNSSLQFSAEEGSGTAMWMILQQRLATLTKDPRADVRNGAIHTIFRTFESCGDQFSDEIWTLSINTVVFSTFQINVEQQDSLRSQDQPAEIADINALNGSSKIIIESSTRLFGTYLENLSRLRTFEEIWHTLLELLASYIDEESYVLSAMCFTAISSILSSAEETSSIGSNAVNEAASLWARDIPRAQSSAENDPTSQDKAFNAYIGAIKEIDRLSASEITEKHTNIILKKLGECIEASTAPPYTNDVDQRTRFQSQVLECYQKARIELNGIPSKLIEGLSEFVRLPYKKHADSVGLHEMTFVAFAKQATEMLETLILSHESKVEIYESHAVIQGLNAFEEAISMKYNWKRQGKAPQLWQMATHSAVVVTQKILPAIRILPLDEGKKQKIWLQIISITEAVQNARYEEQPPISVLLNNETSDLESASILRRTISRHLEEPNTTLSVRRAYIQAQLRVSIIHRSRFDRLPNLDLSTTASTVVADLHKVRLGRTYDPPFNPRIRTCYACLDELFDLVSTAERGSNEQILNTKDKKTPNSTNREAQHSDPNPNLASTTLPYLLLRCALPLKSYIADQPLRGRMPTPMSQRLELIHILDRIEKLRCQPETVAELERELENGDHPVGGVDNSANEEGDGGYSAPKRIVMKIVDPELRHLEFLVPLVNRALREARWDEEVAGAMRRVLDAVLG